MAKISLKKRKLVKKTTSSPTPTETPTTTTATTTGLPQSSFTKPEKTIKKKKNPIAAQQLKLQQNKSPSPPSSDTEPEPEKIHEILQVCSKDQLIDFAVDAAVSFPSLYSKIREIADKDVSHRKLFVHGLSWEATNETLISEFQKYGEIENSNIVVDRVTGKSKGYGFVTFKTRKSAVKALKNPRVEIDNRVVVWQLASTGPASTSGQPQQQQQDGAVSFGGRKIYVNNVASDVNPDRLRDFFSKFGELDSGPTGFDVQTGKFKGYALFVYKSLEGAKKVLEEPYKVFDGRQLHCQKAAEGKKNNGGASGITTAVQPVPPVYAAFAGQNMGFLGQNPGVNLNAGLLSMNPLYSSLLANPNAAAMGMANLSSLGGMGMGLGMGMGITPGVGGYGGLLGNALSNVGSRAPTTMMGPYGGSAGGTMLQGLQYAYQKAEDSPSAPASDTSGAATRSSHQW